MSELELKTIELGEDETCMDKFFSREVIAGRLEPDAAMLIENVHIRAETLNECDGWNKLLDKLTKVQSTPRGELYSADWLETNMLKVICPSTGQTYVLGVPSDKTTVDDALLFVNKGQSEFGEMES
jgi:hypothetical protein